MVIYDPRFSWEFHRLWPLPIWSRRLLPINAAVFIFLSGPSIVRKETARFHRKGAPVSGIAVTRQLAVFTVPHLTCVALQTYYVNAHRASRRYDDSRKEKLGAN